MTYHSLINVNNGVEYIFEVINNVMVVQTWTTVPPGHASTVERVQMMSTDTPANAS